MFSFGGHLTPGWSNRLHVGWRVSLILNGVVTRRITARTRLALHDAILRAGWPSPWHEVGTTLTAPFVADMQAAGWTTKLDTVFRGTQTAGTAEITFDGIRMVADVWVGGLVIMCRADYWVGPIGYRTMYSMTEWSALGAAFHTAELARKYRESAARLLSKL
jgi:hypothetical protein